MSQETITGKQAAILVLTDADGPMKVADVCKAAAKLATSMPGKTPEATIAAGIYTDAKKGKNFRVVGRGLVELLPADAEPQPAPSSEPDSPAATPGTVVLRDASAPAKPATTEDSGKAKPDPKPTSTKKSAGRGKKSSTAKATA